MNHLSMRINQFFEGNYNMERNSNMTRNNRNVFLSQSPDPKVFIN